MTTQQKIAKCLELALQIEGANFDYHPSAHAISIFKISPEDYEYNYSIYDYNRLDELIGWLQKHIATSKQDGTFVNAYPQGDSVVFNYGLNGEFGQAVAVDDVYQYIIDKGYNETWLSEDDVMYTPIVHCLSDNFASITEEYFNEVMIVNLTYDEAL